ncbi:hypothetical protein DYB32_004488 [Aphanomyces invadans]|uniref:Aspartic peptidase DDI1-type domain-containing protein n=1 Tax=Aphanomyces invadans TaxID=157072 RepID=A0A3R6VBN2_9STRA|nr:hypothetical protein DYB32_004488 [Aphanomyces invadans]
MEIAARKYKEEQEALELERNPFSEEAQAKIEEAIRLGNVQQNMEIAMEEMPEAFGRVHMLYIPTMVNNTPVKAFVDSGAQSTIMSSVMPCIRMSSSTAYPQRNSRIAPSDAASCDSSTADTLARYSPTVFNGTRGMTSCRQAVGVGTAKIIGRVHMAPLKIGNVFYNCSFTILDQQAVQVLASCNWDVNIAAGLLFES